MARLTSDPFRRLLAAQEAALSRDERLNTLSMSALRKGVPGFDIAEAITAATVTLTIDGASTLTIGVDDPGWLLESSGLLDLGDDGKLAQIPVALDRLSFALVKASRRDPAVLALTLEDTAKTLLDQRNHPLAASRGAVTRAGFVWRMVQEVKTRYLLFYSPERGRRQPIELPELPDTQPAAGQTGFADNTRFRIKGESADAEQMRQVATALKVADLEGAKGRARLALLVAGIGESTFRDVPNAAGSPYGGVFQALKTRRLTTEQQARYFLRGGQGFQQGGAIKLARENPSMTPGEIATRVEASGKPGSFYQEHIAEARTIDAAWGSGDADTTHEVVTARSYQFTRGKGGERETSWEAATRLADEVGWRFFAVGGVVHFVSDDHLISLAPKLIIRGHDDEQLLEPPGYDWDEGKTAAEVELRAVANRWAVRPGVVVQLDDMGPITGRWIVSEVEQDLLDATETTVRLIKPTLAAKEPAAQLITRTPGGGGQDGSNLAGADRALSWARGKLGHYKEEFGNNRGDELDTLESGFGFTGAPWCAMFATTALVQGGVSRDCLTAAVANINDWCEAGTHGYLRGYKATPRPGDLITFNDDHVGLVEKVLADGSVTTLEGNTSAGQVARRTHSKGEGRFVRPDYPN